MDGIAKMSLLVAFSLFSAFVSASAQNQATCTGLDQLVQNANPSLLSNCAKDSACTRVTCQAAGTIGSYLGSVIFTLVPCGTPPGVRLQLLQASESALVDQIVTSPTTISRSISIATATITVFVNSTTNTVGFRVDPVAIDAGFFGSSSDYLISFTSIPLDLSTCQSPTTTPPEESTVTVPGQTARTCSDLDQLAMNANPSYLSNCARDMACTKVTCQGSGVFSGRIDSAAIILLPCKVPAPGITVSLIQGGTAVVSRTITGHMTITYDAGIATVNVEVFINSTTDSIGILIDPITITSLLGTTTDYLISFTSVALDKSSCAQTTESANTDSDREGSTTTMAQGITDKETGAIMSTTPGPTTTDAESANTDSDREGSTTTMAQGNTDKETGAIMSTTPEPTTTDAENANTDSDLGGHVTTMASTTDEETGATITATLGYTTVPGQTARTCSDLDQLAMNANPSYLSNCARDMACTKVTCQGNGVLSGRIDSAAITLLPCKMPAPGIIVNLVQGGTTVVSQTITSHMIINYDAGIATVNVEVFINSTTDSIGILIDPITIATTFFGTTTDYLISFTSVQLDKSSCAQTTESANTDSDREGSTTTMAQGITDKETGAIMSTTPGPTTTDAESTNTDSDLGGHMTTMASITDEEMGATTTATLGYTTAPVLDTCTGLQQLAMNANPVLLSDCARDAGCTKLTCEAAGIISTQLDSMIITLELCETPPGVTIELLKDGRTIINQLITTPTNITRSLGFVTVAAYVFVNSTQNTLGIAVDPVSINAGSFGAGSETLISFTLVPFNTAQCNNIGSTLQSMMTTNAALSVVLSFGLRLLTMAVVFVNGGRI